MHFSAKIIFMSTGKYSTPPLFSSSLVSITPSYLPSPRQTADMSDNPKTSQETSSHSEPVSAPPPSSLPTSTADIDVELFQRLHPVHYIIFNILKKDNPILVLRVCQDTFDELVPARYEKFVLDESTYKKKMYGAYKRIIERSQRKNRSNKIYERITTKEASTSRVAAFTHIKRLEIADVYTAQKLYLDSATKNRTRWIDLPALFPNAQCIVLGTEVMQCVAHPTKVYKNIKGLIDCLKTAKSISVFHLKWPNSQSTSDTPVSYIRYGEGEEEGDDDSDGNDDSDDADSNSSNHECDSDSECSCGDCDSDSDSDDYPETEYETDDDSYDSEASDDYTDQEYNIGRFIVHRIGIYPALTTVVIRIASNHLIDALMPLHRLNKPIKIIFRIPREPVKAYDVLTRVWNHYLHCLSVYDFDQVKFKIRYDLTKVKDGAQELPVIVKKASGDQLLWQSFLKTLYLPNSPLTSTSLPPSRTSTPSA
ncbi:hypothetical protein IAU59_001188 [Kwoniella sp. CBS 9459]